jgi:hypothetical protein
MDRKIFTPNEKQAKKFENLYQTYEEALASIPNDEEIKNIWKKAHHGKVTGWGMKKATMIENAMTGTKPYQMGLWQGRVDAARDLPYSEERNGNLYNLGYYRGYDGYQSNRGGWDVQTRNEFDQKYLVD